MIPITYSVRSDGGVDARIQTETSLVTLTATGSVHDSEWHHVALVYDIEAHIAELYLDGQLGDSGALFDPLHDTTEPVRLGTLRTTGSLADFYNGRMDELRIWNTARRGTQASCLKDVTLLLDTPGLVSYYRFDEGAGTISYDLVPPYENLTFISGAGFSPNEPGFLSRLNGPGACYCGEVSGTFDSLDPTVMLVGDSIAVPAGDSLVLSSSTLILDSTVTRFNVYGRLDVAGTASDFILYSRTVCKLVGCRDSFARAGFYCRTLALCACIRIDLKVYCRSFADFRDSFGFCGQSGRSTADRERC